MESQESLSDEESETEKSYVDCYLNSDKKDPSDLLRKTCVYLSNFVCNEPAKKQLLTVNGDTNNGWCTEPQILHYALCTQLHRAENRLYSLKQMYALINKSELTCIHQHLLAAYFGLCNVKSEEMCTQLHHYLEGVQTAPRHLQNSITSTVHAIYKLLVEFLQKSHAQSKKYLQLLIIFALSSRYLPGDLDLLVKSDLVTVLMQISNSQTCYNSNKKTQTLPMASSRLMHVVAIFTSVHSKRVEPLTVQKVVNKLYEQLLAIIENTMSYDAVDRVLGDYLVFLRCIASGNAVQELLASNRWIVALLSIIKLKYEASNYVIGHVYGLRLKLLVLQLLQKILIKASRVDRELARHVISELFEQIAEEMWTIPFISAKNEESGKSSFEHLISAESEATGDSDSVPVHNMGFDPEKCHNCTVEGNLTLVHGLSGGYGLGAKSMKSGCYQWKILIVKENKGNEGTCIGISKYPVKDFGHRTTSDMWLYRAYSGSLYHNGERDLSFKTYTQGDYITVVLDMDTKTLSFGKNGEEPEVAFENIDAEEVYPCVMFYSTNAGEKVKITDMQVCTNYKLSRIGLQQKNMCFCRFTVHRKTCYLENRI